MKNKELYQEILNEIKPSKKELSEIEDKLNDFIKKLKEKIEKKGLNVDVFVGGSYAKKTLIKKDFYDIDIFLRFDKKHKEISELTASLLKNFEGVSRMHGSRDYFSIKINERLFFDVVPVLKIKNLREAKNITDLSYFHVRYINKKLKSEEILDEVRLAKYFCHANRCYGAESHINGFSGYGLELLIYYYRSFEKFLRATLKVKEKEVIDIEKQYKNKKQVLLDMNSSKLQSPIILVDPTYKERNVLAALSKETFDEFKKIANEFLKNPSMDYFKKRKINLDELKKQAKNKEFLILEAKTGKQEGAIAGSKLLKFYKSFIKEISYYFDIKKNYFDFNNKNKARYIFIAKPKKEVVLQGPYENDKKNLEKFKKQHKNIYFKNKRAYVKIKPPESLESFIKYWKKKYKKKMSDMDIKELKILN